MESSSWTLYSFQNLGRKQVRCKIFGNQDLGLIRGLSEPPQVDSGLRKQSHFDVDLDTIFQLFRFGARHKIAFTAGLLIVVDLEIDVCDDDHTSL
jgi:hypothetical protein